MEIYIYGPAASGKSVLALKLLEFLEAEGYVAFRRLAGKADPPRQPLIDAEVLSVTWNDKERL